MLSKYIQVLNAIYITLKNVQERVETGRWIWKL